MIASYHRRVQQDVWDVTRYYQDESGDVLADEFFADFMATVQSAIANPSRYHFDVSGLRRASLTRFPYHFLYRVRKEDIFILVLRHHRRDPSFGLRRSF